MMSDDLLLTKCNLYDSHPPDETTDILARNGTITKIGRGESVDGDVPSLDVRGRSVAPGFIDVHIQGAGGADVLDGSLESLQTISSTLARLGTTGFLATTVVHSYKRNSHLELAAEYTGQDLEGAQILGIHLEGPFVNPEKRGGMSRTSICEPSMETLKDILGITGDSLRMMTVAPELEGNLKLIRHLVSRGVIASFGHSNATYEETKNGIDAGITHATHLFNAMPPLHHRSPGPLAAIFEAENVSVQVIADGVHIHPSVVGMIHRLVGPERIICITDGVQAVGLPEGRYVYNGRDYESKNGTARYLNGTLIGTAVGLDQIVKRYKDYTGCSLQTAIDTVTKHPARILGIYDRKGSIEVGKDADLVVLDNDYSIWATIVQGRVVYQKS